MRVRGAPVRDVHRVEGRLEQLVLQQHAHVVRHRGVGLGERLGQPVLPGPDAVLAGVVGAVGEPEAQDGRAGGRADLDALQQVVGGLAADRRVRVADAAEPVVVVLEHVGVDRADPDAGVGRVLGQIAVVVHPVPRDVQGDARRDPGEPVHGRGVVDLLVRVAGHALLREHLEAGARVAVGPGRRLDPLRAQGCLHAGYVSHLRCPRNCRSTMVGRRGSADRRRPAPRQKPGQPANWLTFSLVTSVTFWNTSRLLRVVVGELARRSRPGPRARRSWRPSRPGPGRWSRRGRPCRSR